MNNSVFLSDSLQNNSTYKIVVKEDFISDNENNMNDRKYNIEKFDNKKNSKYVVKSATTRKWSIKFKQ